MRHGAGDHKRRAHRKLVLVYGPALAQLGHERRQLEAREDERDGAADQPGDALGGMDGLPLRVARREEALPRLGLLQRVRIGARRVLQ